MKQPSEADKDLARQAQICLPVVHNFSSLFLR